MLYINKKYLNRIRKRTHKEALTNDNHENSINNKFLGKHTNIENSTINNIIDKRFNIIR